MVNRRRICGIACGGLAALAGASFGSNALATSLSGGTPIANVEKPKSSSKAMRVLILGGTGFIGPYFVRAATERGHRVSVFSRGKSEAKLPPSVERLIGDRTGDLQAIQSRDWDAVIDLATFVPVWVRTLGEALTNRVGHYTLISTIDVYKNPSANATGTTEGSALLEFDGAGDPYAADGGGGSYGNLKAICEREAEKQFPSRSLIVRPGYMVGPNDSQERFTYWLVRLERGGEVLAPGDPLQPVQFIDVRDVAEWVIRMVERGETGPFNTLGPGQSMGLCEMLGGIRGAFGTPMRLNWVSIPWISHQDIVDPDSMTWTIWRFSRDDAIVSDKACARGLTYRPLHTTASDTLTWYKSLPPERQSTVFTGWGNKRWSEPDTRGIYVPWDEILQREKEIIGRWHAHQARG